MKTLTLFKRTVTWSLISSTVLFTPLGIQASTVEEVTNTRRDNGIWVTDMANILSNKTETKLNQMITNLEQADGTEIAAVTASETTQPDSPKAFDTELFDFWGIGKTEKDNGISVLVSTGDKPALKDTVMRSESFRALHNGMASLRRIESILPDAKVGNIIDTKIPPQYKNVNFSRDTFDGSSASISVANPVTNIQADSELTFKVVDRTQASSSVIKTSSFGVVLFICLLVLFIFIVINSDDDSDDGSSGGGRKSPGIQPGSVGGIGGGGCGGGGC